MQQFIDKFQDEIEGVLSGFDRLVFRGSLRSLSYRRWDPGMRSMIATGMEQYLWNSGILFKDYGQHVKQVCEQIKACSLKLFERRKLPVIYVSSGKTNKEQMAREVAREREIAKGPVCVLSTMEPSPTFDHRGRHIVARVRPCQVLYHYQIHPIFGWMYARIQSWFPFNIQIGMNGREWLARQLDRARIGYHKVDNCFDWVKDYERAQALLEQQLTTDWPELLNGIAQTLNPRREQIFEHYPAEYYWTCYQSEWATDITFRKAEFLRQLMPKLVRHGLLSFSSADVMRYLGRKPTLAGTVRKGFAGTLEIDLKRREEGERVKFRLNWNSLKFYDKLYNEGRGVLRGAETTINQVQDFRVYRPKEGGEETDLQWRPMRQGIADLHRRAEVSQKANERLLNAMASTDESRTVQEITTSVQQPVIWPDRRVRALRPWADDHSLLTAINHGEFLINGFRNRDLQALLYSKPTDSAPESRRRSAAISRKLRLLRAHGLIQKVPRTNRYQVTTVGRSVLLAVLTSARTSLNALDRAA